MEHITLYLLAVALSVFVYETLWFLIGLLTKRNDIADVAWGPGIALVAMVALVLAPQEDVRLSLLATLMFLWGIRLSLHILERVLRKGEDYRYRAWRESWKYFLPRSYAQIYLLQGFLMIVLAYPAIHVAAFGGGALGLLDILGLTLWTIGFLFEVYGDKQLARFLANPAHKGAVCDQGLWKYTRHPNYFGEITLWWGVGLIALSSPWGFLALVSPITITVLLLYVSGVPLLEKKAMENPAYRAYAERTSKLFPLPPKRLVERGVQG